MKAALEKDIIALNRESVKHGLVTEREQMKYRQGKILFTIFFEFFKSFLEHDLRVLSKKQNENRQIHIPDIMFGVPTRPSTPIFDLLEHKYQKVWQKEQAHKQNKAKEAAKVRHRVGMVSQKLLKNI